jgi:hypothetical protein
MKALNKNKSLSDIKPTLKLEAKSEHFLIHYGLRNPMPMEGPGLGAHGVRDRVIVRTYLRSLERLYREMTAKPWSRKRPMVSEAGRIEVYVFDISELILADGSPFTSVADDKPYICLPSGSYEPSRQAELHRAEAEAVHEATHVFNHSKRPLGDHYSAAWEWVDEALAVLMEISLIPGNQDHFRFLKNWVELPEVSLDNWAARYQAGLFACYLESKLPGFLNQVWMKAELKESPLAAMKRLFRADKEFVKFVSHHPDERDLFASGYCLDSYFLWDHNNDWFPPELCARFGERAVSESFIVRPGAKACSEKWQLDHLACRYFRIALKGEIENLRLEVPIEMHGGDAPKMGELKAELAVVTDEMHKGKHWALRPAPAKGEGEEARLVLDLPVAETDYDKADHLVLVVSNCGTHAATVKRDKPHDDKRKFRVTISAD